MLGVEPTTPRAGVREQRRQTRHVLRRRERVRRRLERGQTLVIFALSLTALLGLAGLTIDVARAYDLFARMQRAAEAGALAGVLYLPNNYNTVRSGSVDSAISAASKAVIMNGFGTAPRIVESPLLADPPAHAPGSDEVSARALSPA